MKSAGADALREYVVWEPILGATSADVPAATRVVPDERAKHFWTGDDTLASQFAGTLGLKGPAWDVYLVFDSHVRWKGGEPPPKPVWWMHQLSPNQKPTAPRLDAAVFREHVDTELARSR